MSLSVAEIIHALEGLTVEERRLFESLVRKHPNLGWIYQLSASDFVELSSEEQAARKAEAEYILASTQGSWGNLSREKIDVRLARQRRFDWGE